MGSWEADVVLADGRSAHLRPALASDQRALETLYESLSDVSRYRRFFSPVSEVAAGKIGPDVSDDARHFALVAELDDQLIGVADYYRKPDDVAEVAFAVRDEQQGRGLGTILLDHIANVAAARGIRFFVAEVLVHNAPMRAVFHDAGFDVRSSRSETGVVEVVLDLHRTDRWFDAYAAREHSAEARSVRRLVTPRSIAVVGASRRRESIGNAILRNLVHGGFSGTVVPVNPHAPVVEGIAASPTVAAIDGPVDLAVLAVPAAAVEQVLHDCAAKRVEGVVVVASGFAEAGAVV